MRDVGLLDVVLTKMGEKKQAQVNNLAISNAYYSSGPLAGGPIG